MNRRSNSPTDRGRDDRYRQQQHRGESRREENGRRSTKRESRWDEDDRDKSRKDRQRSRSRSPQPPRYSSSNKDQDQPRNHDIPPPFKGTTNWSDSSSDEEGKGTSKKHQNSSRHHRPEYNAYSHSEIQKSATDGNNAKYDLGNSVWIQPGNGQESERKDVFGGELPTIPGENQLPFNLSPGDLRTNSFSFLPPPSTQEWSNGGNRASSLKRKDSPPAPGIQIKLPAVAVAKPISATIAADVLKPKSLKVASVFNVDSDDEEDEMPPECKMRMKNIGRETPTSAGPNSYGKTKMGFCNVSQIRERELQDRIKRK